MFRLIDFVFSALVLWLAAWQRLGDRNGWLALCNAWSWWFLTAAFPAGIGALGRRHPLAGLGWAVAAGALWLQRFGWTLPRRGRVDGSDSGLNEAAPPDRAFSLLTFNLLNNPRDLSPLVQMAQEHAPDLLLLQECIPPHAAQLETALAAHYPYRLWLPAPEYNMGFGIASRRPFALTGLWQYPGFEPFAARITLAPDSPGFPSTPLDVYCVQFISPTNEVRRVGPTGLLRLRERQVGWVLDEITRRGVPAVVAGDWNTTEGSDAYRHATDLLVDGWREAGRGPGWSWPVSLNPFVDRRSPPLLRLDYTMHTGAAFAPGVRVASMAVIRSPLGSDHAPLFARLKRDF